MADRQACRRWSAARRSPSAYPPAWRASRPARSAAEGGGHFAGPPPRLDGHRGVEHVQIPGDGTGVHRLAQRPARPVPQQADDAGVARDAQFRRPRLQPGGVGQRPLRVAAQQRQPPGEQAVLQLQPPAENQVDLVLQDRQRLRQPRLRPLRIAGVQALLGQILQGGDGDLRGSLALRHLQRLGVVVERLLRRAQVAQHPAGEVHRAAAEARPRCAARPSCRCRPPRRRPRPRPSRRVRAPRSRRGRPARRPGRPGPARRARDAAQAWRPHPAGWPCRARWFPATGRFPAHRRDAPGHSRRRRAPPRPGPP